MTDIGLFIQKDCTIDIEFENDDLRIDEGLETSFLITVYTDGRATPEDVEGLEFEAGEIEQTLRGYWGDMFPEVPGDQIGSLLWTTHRHKQTNENRLDIQNKTERSMQWYKDDGISEEITVNTTIIGKGDTLTEVTMKRPDEDTETKFSTVWNNQGLVR